MIKIFALATLLSSLVATSCMSQKKLANKSNGNLFDTLSYSFPKIEVRDKSVFPILDTLIYSLRDNSRKNTLRPFFGFIDFVQTKPGNFIFSVTNDHEVVLEPLVNFEKSVNGVFTYKGMNYFIRAKPTPLDSVLFVPANDSLRTFFVVHKSESKSYDQPGLSQYRIYFYRAGQFFLDRSYSLRRPFQFK